MQIVFPSDGASLHAALTVSWLQLHVEWVEMTAETLDKRAQECIAQNIKLFL